ncbi:MAG: twin-arginine translocation signal domain-containing protein [Patescibacteria group bacterium]|nr:hypothetical protein [Patescibacteria group bacterium]
MENMERRRFLQLGAAATVASLVPGCVSDVSSDTSEAASEVLEAEPIDELMNLVRGEGFVVSRVDQGSLEKHGFVEFVSDSTVLQVWPEGAQDPSSDWIFDVDFVQEDTGFTIVHWYSDITESGEMADCYLDQQKCQWGTDRSDMAQYKRRVDFQTLEEAAQFIVEKASS